jgi:hypothetical protein
LTQACRYYSDDKRRGDRDQNLRKNLGANLGVRELRDDIGYTNAWNSVVDTLVKRFDLEILSQQDGYMRTTWLYTWTGTVRENYRVRVTAKFSPDHKVVEIKSEAEHGGPRQLGLGLRHTPA